MPSLSEKGDLLFMGLIGFLIDTLLGPFNMSPANQAGSVSEISPSHFFFVKVSMCSKKGRGGPVTKTSLFATEISVNRMEIFPYEHSCQVTGTTFLRQK